MIAIFLLGRLAKRIRPQRKRGRRTVNKTRVGTCHVRAVISSGVRDKTKAVVKAKESEWVNSRPRMKPASIEIRATTMSKYTTAPSIDPFESRENAARRKGLPLGWLRGYNPK